MSLSLSGSPLRLGGRKGGIRFMTAAAAAAADPIVTAAPWAWLKADAVTGKTDGNSLATWSDSSGNSRDGTTAGTLTYETNEVNTKPGIAWSQFAGAGYILPALLADSLSASMSLFLVLRVADISGNRGVCGIRGSTAGGWWLRTTTAGVLSFSHNGSTTVTSVGTVSVGTPAIASLVKNGTAVELRVNNAGLGSGTMAAYTAKSGNPSGLAIGAEGGTGNFWWGLIPEVIAFDRAVTSTERSDIHAALGTKYNIAVS